MGRKAAEFRDALHERWRGESPEQEEKVVRSVLVHLRRRLTGPEVEHIEERLPPDVRSFWAEPELEARREGERPLEKTDFRAFLKVVRDEAGLPDLAEAEKATVAVFHALDRFLDDEEREHVANVLPGGLKEDWIEETGAPKPSQKTSHERAGSSPRWTSDRPGPGSGTTARRSPASRGSRSWSKRK